MATLVDTLDAVKALIDPLVTAGTLERAEIGMHDQRWQTPYAEIRFGPSLIGRNPEAGVLERQAQRLGSVRVYIARLVELSDEVAKFAPIIDAIEAAFRDAPIIDGIADRFDATGNSGVGDEGDLLFVDVNWSALSIEPDTYVQDW